MRSSRILGAVLLALVLAAVACDPKKGAARPTDDAVDASMAAVTPPVPSALASVVATADTADATTADASPTGSMDASSRPPSPPPFDTTCTRDEDCVPAPGCCPVPCTSRVINRSELARARAENAKTCPPGVQCMSAGGCRTHAYLCVRKTCALVYSDSPDFRSR